MKKRYWLLLEKSDDTRVSKGIDRYFDKTGEVYNYDSMAPNHKQLASGDYVVLRKENKILGVGLCGKFGRAQGRRYTDGVQNVSRQILESVITRVLLGNAVRASMNSRLQGKRLLR